MTESAQASVMARRRLEPGSCALLVIDVQEKLLPPIHEAEHLVRNVQLLLRLANILALPVIATTQYSRGLGGIVPAIASLLPKQSSPLDKSEFGCFSNRDFCAALKPAIASRNTLVICGMEAHICVTQTVLGALEQGYLVHVASDAVGSRSEWNWRVGLDRMRDAGALISSTEMIIYELLAGSGTPAFKQMLPFLKA